jgi:predicted glycosyltransferase
MRVWVDITDSSHVLFLAPVVRRLEDRGDVVTVTARRFASAELILRRYGIATLATSQHRGGGPGARTVGLLNRTAQLLGSAASGRFDVAVGGHASDFILANWALGVPQLTLLDDERLRRTNAVNVRLVDRVAVPEAVPTAVLAELGAAPRKLFRYPGFNEEYYLRDLALDREVLAGLRVDRRRVVGVVRPRHASVRRAQRLAPPPEPEDRALEELVRELAGRRNVTVVVLARDEAQRARYAALRLPSVVTPPGPVDTASLLAAADFVLGGGGVIEREAAALGTPAYTLRALPASAVDAVLRREGRIRRVTAAGEIELRKKDSRTLPGARRDPGIFVEALAGLAAGGRSVGRFERLV